MHCTYGIISDSFYIYRQHSICIALWWLNGIESNGKERMEPQPALCQNRDETYSYRIRRKTVCLFLAVWFSSHHTPNSPAIPECTQIQIIRRKNKEILKIPPSSRILEWKSLLFTTQLSFIHSFEFETATIAKTTRKGRKKTESHNGRKTNPARFPIGMHQLRWSAGVSGVE